MKPNRLRQLLNEGKPSLGTVVVSPWPALVEIIGLSGGFDYIEYSGENAPLSLEQLDNFGRTIELFPNMSSMIKLDEHNRGFIATRAIGSGLQNVLFTGCRSAEDVRECIRIVKPGTPEIGGTQGISQRRAYSYMLDEDVEGYIKAMNDTVVCVSIECKEAVDHIEEILSVPGLDMIYFGPQDYSVSVGKPGRREDPEVIAAKSKVTKLAIKKGVAMRMSAYNLEQMKQYLEMGVRHFCAGNDVRILYAWYQDQGEKVRKLLAQA